MSGDWIKSNRNIFWQHWQHQKMDIVLTKRGETTILPGERIKGVDQRRKIFFFLLVRVRQGSIRYLDPPREYYVMLVRRY